jgi:hypothetical protein
MGWVQVKIRLDLEPSPTYHQESHVRHPNSRQPLPAGSVETFVVEAVQLRLQDEPLRLSPEQVAIIRQSQAEIKAGKGLTMEQVETRLATKKAEWLAANPA